MVSPALAPALAPAQGSHSTVVPSLQPQQVLPAQHWSLMHTSLPPPRWPAAGGCPCGPSCAHMPGMAGLDMATCVQLAAGQAHWQLPSAVLPSTPAADYPPPPPPGAARALLQHHQRWQPRRQRPGHAGVHDPAHWVSRGRPARCGTRLLPPACLGLLGPQTLNFKSGMACMSWTLLQSYPTCHALVQHGAHCFVQQHCGFTTTRRADTAPALPPAAPPPSARPCRWAARSTTPSRASSRPSTVRGGLLPGQARLDWPEPA